MQVYDVIVVGGGGVGSSTAWHLARRGARVLVIEQFHPGHARGSSHGETRIIRQAYFEHPDYVPLLLRAYQLWEELEEQIGGRLLERVGLLEVGPPEGAVVPGVLRAARQHGLEVDKLSHREVADRFPPFRIPEGMLAVFERAAGYLRVESCVLAHLSAAKAAGAAMVFNTAVRKWSAGRSGVRVVTDTDEYQAEKLIITAGAWAPQLLGQLGVQFEVLRKNVYWYTSGEAALSQDSGCPTFLFELPEGVFYGFPQRDSLGVKVAEHSGGDVVQDPTAATGSEQRGDQDRVEAFLSECVPAVTPPLIRHSACFYTMSPDGHFVIDQHPLHEKVLLAAGLSGHGFKFTSVLGEVLAERSLHMVPTTATDFLKVARFFERH